MGLLGSEYSCGDIAATFCPNIGVHLWERAAGSYGHSASRLEDPPHCRRWWLRQFTARQLCTGPALTSSPTLVISMVLIVTDLVGVS